MFIHLNLDIQPLLQLEQQLQDASTEAMKTAGERLTAMTRAHIMEEAQQKLHTRRQMYLDGLSHYQVDDNTWVVNLDAKVRWIDDGLPEHNMIDDLLKSPKAKTSKDGSRYLSIPFRHGPKGPTQMTPAQKTLLDTIKSELKQRKISYAKIETDKLGKPKLGLLHSFDINTKPLRATDGRGQGKGPIGSVMQGPTGIPLLKGVRIYQHAIQNPDGTAGTRRDIMTFRTVSSKQKGQGRWDYPGIEGVHFMDEAYEWAKRTWEKEIVPEILALFEKVF